MDRIINFGKYKGKAYKQIIITHIGYVTWCLENLRWFYLNQEEQEIYDALAISIKKYNANMAFPVEKMYKHVKDTYALSILATPLYIDYRGVIQVDTKSNIYNKIKRYKENVKDPLINIMSCVAREMDDFEFDENEHPINCVADM